MATKIDNSKIIISLRTGTVVSSREVIVSWTGAKEISNTKGFNVELQQWINGQWMKGQSVSTQLLHNAKWSDLEKSVYITVDDAAIKVRARVQPVSDTHKVDDSDKEYYKDADWSNWSAEFKGWDKTSKPPAFKIEKKNKKSNKDLFKIEKDGNSSLVASFNLTKARMSKFLTFLTGFSFKWQGWNGSEWTDVSTYETYISYNSSGKNAPGSGLVTSGEAIVVFDQVKTAIRNQTTSVTTIWNPNLNNGHGGYETVEDPNASSSYPVEFRSYIHPSQSILTYKFSVTPVSENQYAFDPIESYLTLKYRAKEFKVLVNSAAGGLTVSYDVEEDKFIAKLNSANLDPFSPTINHVSSFDLEWTYLKPEINIWENATGSSYPSGDRYTTPATASIDPLEYEEREIKYEIVVDRYGNERSSALAGRKGFTTIERTMKVYTWKSEFELPEGVRRDTPIRVRVKIKGDNNQSWIEAWSDWVDYTYALDKKTVNMAMINRPTTSSRKIDLLWTMYHPEKTSGFSYQWYYTLRGDNNQSSDIWRDDKNGTVDITQTVLGFKEATTIIGEHYKVIEDGTFIDLTKENDEYTNSEKAATLITRVVGFNVWSVPYDIPAEAASIMVTITPSPSISGAYLGAPIIVKFDVTIPTIAVNQNSVEIIVSDAEAHELMATWDNIGIVDGVDYSDYVSGYQCRWEYLKNNKWFSQEGTAAYSKLNFGEWHLVSDAVSEFTVPDLNLDPFEDLTQVRFTVRPVPTDEGIFKGINFGYKYFNIKPTPLKLNTANLVFTVDSTTSGTLLAHFLDVLALPNDAWPRGTSIEDKQITFEWSSFLNGIWQSSSIASDNVRIDYANDSYSVPEGAQKVRLRVKPVVDNLQYIGDWTDYIEKDLDLDVWLPENIEVEMLPGSRTTAIASWDIGDPNNFPNGLTAEKYIESFTYQWGYYWSGRWWHDSTQDMSVSDVLSRLVDEYAVTYEPSKTGTTAVSFRIKANPKNVLYFKDTWSGESVIDIPLDNIPDVPDVPTATLSRDGYTITVTTSTYDTRAAYIQFYGEDEIGNPFYSGSVTLSANTATWQMVGEAGRKYKFKARAINEDNEYKSPEVGDYTADPDGYSNWCSEVYTRPSPVHLISVKGIVEQGTYGARLDWEGGTLFGGSGEPGGYMVQRTQKSYYFDAGGNVETETWTDSDAQYRYYTNLEPGTWYFRVAIMRGESSSGVYSDWSNIENCTLGKPPTAPTTWSNRTTGMVGDEVYLYWTHNSADNSDEEIAYIEYIINGTTRTISIQKEGVEDEQSSFKIPDEYLTNESFIQWRVKTKGAYDGTGSDDDGYSPWSTQRIIKLYSPPSISMALLTGSSSDWSDYVDENTDKNGVYAYSVPGTELLAGNVLHHYPLFVRLSASPVSQTPVAYALTITSNNTYETVDEVGRKVGVSAGMTLFRRYYNTSERQFTALIMPGEVSLMNGMSYNMTVTVAMDSSLTATNTIAFTTDFVVDEYRLSASLGYDKEKIIAYIKPYCMNDDNVFINTVNLALYRREFDGGFTLIADNIPGSLQPVITDPHPTLDYARYRVVGTDKETGMVFYEDLAPHPIHETSIILQWEESWSSYYENGELEMADRPWNGSMIKLPFNVDTTDSNTVDVEMVEYIGRSHPVSYYGTQIGQKATWNALIPKTDKQTIYDLRRLARYMGNVYVREPSGTGYWAHVEVSFNLTHLETTVPVSLSITRVEGGM